MQIYNPGGGGGGGLTFEEILADMGAANLAVLTLGVGAESQDGYVATFGGNVIVDGTVFTTGGGSFQGDVTVDGNLLIGSATILGLESALITVSPENTTPAFKIAPIENDPPENTSGNLWLWFDGSNLRGRIGTTSYTFTKT